ILLLCAVAVSVFAAAPAFYIHGSASFERDRISRLEKSLNFTQEPMVETWTVWIIPGAQFRESVHDMNLDTDSAYTILGYGQTYLNEDYLIYADDMRVRQTLAHEAGHLICACASESKAND